MPNFTATTTITTGDGTVLSASKTGVYTESFNLIQSVDNSDTFVTLITGGTAKGISTIPSSSALIVKNSGDTGVELMIATYQSTAGSPDATASIDYHTYLLGVNDYIFLPNLRQTAYSSLTSGANGATLSNQVPNANMYIAVNNVAASDEQVTAEALDISETDIDVEEGAYFFVGDLIRVEDEIMEVTGITADVLTVIRGVHGSTAATHVDPRTLSFPFFNKYTNFTAATGGYDKVQTDEQGRYWTTNFFGYGRNTDGSGNNEANGLVGGSISGKFYSSGYQGFGLKDVTSSTSSGLAVSTAYGFDLTVDGGTVLDDAVMTFTTDSSNVNWGGTNGIIEKIQEVLDTQYRTTSSSIIGKKVSIGIVNGDIRITSGSHLSTSAILIGAGDGTPTTPFGVGAVPAIAKVASPVAAALPPDEILDPRTGISSPNKSVFFYDDGHGRIKGACSGRINYTTGEMKLSGCPPLAQFVVSANYGSAHSGGNRFTADEANSISAIYGRSTNSKLDGLVEITGLD